MLLMFLWESCYSDQDVVVSEVQFIELASAHAPNRLNRSNICPSNRTPAS
jgi:hypothetical protein